MINLIVIATGLLAYVIGSIPTGYIIAYIKGIKDIRQHGSGTIGATNVARFLGIQYFFLIFFLDAAKAFLFMYFIQPYYPVNYLYLFAGIFLFGNTCSLFLYGSGGKGVATLLGLMSALNLTSVGIFLIVWCICMVIIKTVGIASVIAIASLPLYAYLCKESLLVLFLCIVSTWIIWLHRSNIRIYWEKCCIKK